MKWHYGIIEHQDFFGKFYALHEFFNVEHEEIDQIHTLDYTIHGSSIEDIANDLKMMLNDVEKYGIHKTIDHRDKENITSQLDKREMYHLENLDRTIPMEEINSNFFKYKERYQKLEDALCDIKSMLENSSFENISIVKRVIENIDKILGDK